MPDMKTKVGEENNSVGGRYIGNKGMLARFLLKFSRMHFFWYMAKYLNKGASVLEFGPAGGNLWIAQYFKVTGIELSPRSAEACRQVYPEVQVGNICDVGTLGRTFDGVASSFVLEHMAEEEAAAALRGCWAVLKPGGVLICLCDLDCDHPILARVRKHYPDAWREAFINIVGHIGLRREDDWKKLISSSGYNIVEWVVQSRFPVLDSCPMIQLSISPANGRVLRLVGTVFDRLNQVPYVMTIWNFAFSFLDWMTRPFLPRQWGYRLLFVAKKPE